MNEEELNKISETFVKNIWQGLGGPDDIAKDFLESLTGFKQRLREQRNRYPRFPEDVQINYIDLMDTRGEDRNMFAGWNILPEGPEEGSKPPGVNQGKHRGITKPAVCPRKRKKK